MSVRRRAAPRLIALVVLLWFVLGPGTSPAGGQDKPADDIPLSATFFTEGVVPVTEIEVGFSFISSDVTREYQFGFSSLQYAWDNTFSLKLFVPFAVIEPRGDGPTVAGPQDLQLQAKYTPLVSREHLLALGAALRLTLPSGSEARGLGGTLALAPGLLAGKAWRLGDRILALQADAFYNWQLDRPARIVTESGASSPDHDQRLTANLTVAHAPIHWLTGILEVNTVTVIAGDPELRGRVQMYLTPGVSLEPAAGWSFRAGVQVPLTRARELDYNVIFLATKGF
jgi:hypothetical protein